jgi:DUF1707 SHOCT-like domain
MTDKKIGDVHREACVAHLQSAFAAGFLTDDEMQDRISAALGARTDGRLAMITADLPTSLELRGRKARVRVRDRMARHPVVLILGGGIASVVTAIVPPVYIANLPHPGGHIGALGSVIMALTIIIGVIGALAALVAGVNLGDAR